MRLRFLSFGLLSLMATVCTGQVVLKKDDKFKKTTTMDMQITTHVMGEPMDIANKTTTYESVLVKDANAEGFTMEHTINRLVAEAQIAGQTMIYDTDDKNATDIQSTLLKAKVAEKYTIQTTKEGLIKNVSGSSDLNPGELNKVTQGAYYELVFPAGKDINSLKVGDALTDTLKDDESTTIRNYKVTEAAAGKDICLSVQGKTTMKGKMPMMGGVEGNMALSGTLKGKSYYSRNTGVLTKSSLTVNMSGTMEQAGQETPIAMKMVSTNELKKD